MNERWKWSIILMGMSMGVVMVVTLYLVVKYAVADVVIALFKSVEIRNEPVDNPQE